MKTLTQRQINNRIKKQNLEIDGHKNQKPVKSLTINIEWKRSRMGGMNPHAEAVVEFHDGTFERRNGYKASGCGYDKESTVIAQVFNDFLRYKLYGPLKWKDRINGEDTRHPYGVYYYDGYTEPATESKREANQDWCVRKPIYNGGVGTSCYYKIAEFIGGSFEHVANGKTFDRFRYVDGVQAHA